MKKTNLQGKNVGAGLQSLLSLVYQSTLNRFDSDSSFVFLLVVSKNDEFPNLMPVVEPIEPIDGGLGVCDEMPARMR